MVGNNTNNYIVYYEVLQNNNKVKLLYCGASLAALNKGISSITLTVSSASVAHYTPDGSMMPVNWGLIISGHKHKCKVFWVVTLLTC